MRASKVITRQDAAGPYEMEVFNCPNPKRVIIGAHGNGVRRWDGEKFYYAVAEHFADSVVVLVDQNQVVGDGCKINPLPILVARVAEALKYAVQQFPELPKVIMAHSMGCGLVTQLQLNDVDAIFFVAAAVGTPTESMIERYGADIVNGKTVKTSDGLTKIITKEYYDSVRGITWEEEYKKLVERFSPVHAFEAGDDEIVGDGRFAHRSIPFTSYKVVAGAKHNFSGEPLNELFASIDKQL